MSLMIRKLAKGSGLGVVYFLIQVGVSFFMMPFLIKSLGKDIYAIWILLGTFIGYYGFLDLGVTAAVARYVSKLIGSKEDERNKNITSTAFYLFSLIGIIICFISFCVVNLSWVTKQGSNVKYSLLILGLGIGASFPLRVFDGVLNATLRIDIKRIIEIVVLIFVSLLMVYVVTTGYGLLGMAIVSAGGGFLDLLAKTVISFYIYPFVSINPKKIDKSVVKQIFNFGFYNFIQNISAILNSKLDSFVIAGFVNLTSVTYYGVVLNLGNYFSSVFQLVLAPFGPLVSQQDGAKDSAGMKKVFLFVTKIIMFPVCFTGGMILLYGNSFIVLWLGDQFRICYTYLLILFIPLTLYLAIGASSGFFLNYSGRHRFVAITNLLEGLLNLVISLILVRYYGVVGVALGTAISMLLFGCMIRPIRACKYLGFNAGKFYVEILVDFFKVIILMIILRIFLTNQKILNYADLLKILMTNAIIVLPIIYFVLLKKTERGELRQIYSKNTID